MKLKKIASLMLAGVMAISMLAGCSGNTDPNPGEGEGETSTATSYSTELRAAMTGEAKERVTAVANSKLDSALEQTVKKYFVINDYVNTVHTYVTQVDNNDNCVIFNKLVTAVDAEKGIAAALDKDNTKTTTAVNLYVVNATTSDEYALEQIAAKISEGVAGLPKVSEDTNYKYTYDISASIVTKTVTSSVVQGVETGVKYIAVAVTQNVTKVV